MLCEMCGKDVEHLVPTRIEGTVLELCGSCSRFGTPLSPPAPAAGTGPESLRAAPAVARPLPRGRNLEERDLFREMPELELADDWPRRIRAAREKLAWTPEELAKRLNEKKSVVLKLEAGSFHPPDSTVRKIEHLLKIRLQAAAPDSASLA